jgi:hypothetical protein
MCLSYPSNSFRCNLSRPARSHHKTHSGLRIQCRCSLQFAVVHSSQWERVGNVADLNFAPKLSPVPKKRAVTVCLGAAEKLTV